MVPYDLQSLGCRIYTYITTLKYFLEIWPERSFSLWVLDRPNPAGRHLNGMIVHRGQESFVGCDEIIMRYGLTNGEHGRLETRKIWTTSTLNQYLDFPFVGQAFATERRSPAKKTGKLSATEF